MERETILIEFDSSAGATMMSVHTRLIGNAKNLDPLKIDTIASGNCCLRGGLRQMDKFQEQKHFKELHTLKHHTFF